MPGPGTDAASRQGARRIFLLRLVGATQRGASPKIYNPLGGRLAPFVPSAYREIRGVLKRLIFFTERPTAFQSEKTNVRLTSELVLKY